MKNTYRVIVETLTTIVDVTSDISTVMATAAKHFNAGHSVFIMWNGILFNDTRTLRYFANLERVGAGNNEFLDARMGDYFAQNSRLS